MLDEVEEVLTGHCALSAGRGQRTLLVIWAGSLGEDGRTERRGGRREKKVKGIGPASHCLKRGLHFPIGSAPKAKLLG